MSAGRATRGRRCAESPRAGSPRHSALTHAAQVVQARLRYASTDGAAADRRADALALRAKSHSSYEHRDRGQDVMRCGGCAKQLVRCLAARDASGCRHHRGTLETVPRGEGGQVRWSCCRAAAGMVGCQDGGQHSWAELHGSFEDWWQHTVAFTLDNDAGAPVSLSALRGGGSSRSAGSGDAGPRSVGNVGVGGSGVSGSREGGEEEYAAAAAHIAAELAAQMAALPPRARWVAARQRAAWAATQHVRLGGAGGGRGGVRHGDTTGGCPAARLPPDLCLEVVRQLPPPPASLVQAQVRRLLLVDNHDGHGGNSLDQGGLCL